MSGTVNGFSTCFKNVHLRSRVLYPDYICKIVDQEHELFNFAQNLRFGKTRWLALDGWLAGVVCFFSKSTLLSLAHLYHTSSICNNEGYILLLFKVSPIASISGSRSHNECSRA